MRVLGIDPGYGRMGVAVLETGRILFSDCVETDKSQPFNERLKVLAGNCEKIIKKWRPERVAIEKLFFTKNQKTAMQVAETRGMITHLANMHNLAVAEYSPQQVKVAVTGSGAANKRQVASMIQKLLLIKKLPKHDDEYDAIAIALTDLAYRQAGLSTGRHITD